MPGQLQPRFPNRCVLHCVTCCHPGPSFTEHLHYGLDTLTDLLLHATVTCHTPLQHTTLLLLCEALTPATQAASSSSSSGSNVGASLLLATLERLAAAAVAVLPDITADELVAAAAGSGGGLQPAPETLQSYDLACRWVACWARCMLALHKDVQVKAPRSAPVLA